MLRRFGSKLSCRSGMRLRVSGRRSISTIPYDPALSLGNIIDVAKLNELMREADLVAEIDAKKERLDNLERFKRELDMIQRNLRQAGIQVDAQDQRERMNKMNEFFEEAQMDYFDTAFENFEKMAEDGQAMVSATLESPVDWTKSQLKQDLPIAADSIKLDSQYFTFDSNTQTSATHMGAVSSFVQGSFEGMGIAASGQASSAVNSQMSAQMQQHNVKSTLVVTCQCTHRNAILVEPLVIDVDKAIIVWNEAFPTDRLQGTSPRFMMNEYYTNFTEGSSGDSKAKPNALYILSGATYGSSFVGMVTFVDTSTTKSSQRIQSTAMQAKAQLEVNRWFNFMVGGGYSKSSSSDFKSLMSDQSINCHFNMYCNGLIPTIASNVVEFGVKQFAGFDAAEMGQKLATLSNSTTEASTIEQGAAEGRTQGQMGSMQAQTIESVMSGLEDMKTNQDSILNVNTMMTALENYAQMAAEGAIGVPINYLIKPLNKKQLTLLWMKKFYPSLLWGDEQSKAAAGGEEAAE